MLGQITRPVRVRIPPLGFAALLITLGAVSGAASDARERRAFIEGNRCAIVERLYSIHLRGPRSTSRNRFLTASQYGAPDHYTQCIFFENDTRMFCEASSGRYSGIDDLLDASAIATLKALGFHLDNPNGNFAREIEIGTPPDFDRVADLMLGALHDAYGVGSDDRREFIAPMAQMPRNACPGPVS